MARVQAALLARVPEALDRVGSKCECGSWRYTSIGWHEYARFHPYPEPEVACSNELCPCYGVNVNTAHA